MCSVFSFFLSPFVHNDQQYRAATWTTTTTNKSLSPPGLCRLLRQECTEQHLPGLPGTARHAAPCLKRAPVSFPSSPGSGGGLLFEEPNKIEACSMCASLPQLRMRLEMLEALERTKTNQKKSICKC